MNILSGTVDTYENWYRDWMTFPDKSATFDDVFGDILVPVTWDGYAWIETL